MIAIVVGTRPEIIKMAPVLNELEKRQLEHIFIHSNQHYSPEMDQQIIDDLGLSSPDYNLHIGSASHAIQTARILERIEEVFLKTTPKIVLVHGDTNTTLGAALTARKMHIPVGHVEAGLRSFDQKMPEEINRIVVDRLSELLFAPTEGAQDNLIKEGVEKKDIIVTGNTVVDALYRNREIAKKNNTLEKFDIKELGYILLTAHRPENVDKKERLSKLVEVVEYISNQLEMPVIWPIHPRTQKQLEIFKITLSDNIQVVPPVGYLDMLNLLNYSGMVLTDSGGLQEEAYILHKPLITLRDSTERPETLTANFLVDLDTEKAAEALEKYKNNEVKWSDSFGDGKASERIINTIKEKLHNG